MGKNSAAEIDAWLRNGGVVVTASERATRWLTAAFHRARRHEGLTAWPAPAIHDWHSFVRNGWDARGFDGRAVLNQLQEQSIWAGIVAAAAPQAAALPRTRDRLASLAMEAHRLLCDYAPRFLEARARSGWAQDAAAFSTWLTEFDAICRDGRLISPARLPLLLNAVLESEPSKSSGSENAISRRPPPLLAGFDRILPTQRELFDAWGRWSEAASGEGAAQVAFYEASDSATELAACALWCKARLAADPQARLLVVAQDVRERRGAIERAFLRFARSGDSPAGLGALFEFSLGVPLNQVALAHGAQLVLHWLTGAIDENELDWLVGSGAGGASERESLTLAAFMRALRRRSLARTRWTLRDFLRQRPGPELPAPWTARMLQARRKLEDFARRAQTPLEWAELAPRLLETCGWPGARAFSSAEFQALRRWRQALDDCASLGFNGRRMEWGEFLAALDRALDETLFAPESQDAPILIAGAAETAGLTADAIWFLGTSEDAWPAAGATHPLLPLTVQREAQMPHASAQLDWDVAEKTTQRLLSSAGEVHFSYARQNEDVEARPSRLIEQVAAAPQPLTVDLIAPAAPGPATEAFDDASLLPFPQQTVLGGSNILTAQSQCPFKAFATARLGAKYWDLAEAGLTAAERGQLLHAVLHSVWAGPPHGIRSRAELVALPDLTAFVHGNVEHVLQEKMPARARESMPQRYLELEKTRLIALVTEWLRFESERVPFTVAETEADASPSIAGLALKLRLDRIDKLIDDTLLVVDYKSGIADAKAWGLPRPDDVQLPQYACFALDKELRDRIDGKTGAETGNEALASDDAWLGGLVLAKVRTGDMNFDGLVRNARATLISTLGPRRKLVSKPLTQDQISGWTRYISRCAEDFLAGRADVDPREYPETCQYCKLQALCRIQENQPQSGGEDGDEACDV